MANAGYGNHATGHPKKAGSGEAPPKHRPETPAAKEANRDDHGKTPGAGAMPAGPQGREVDPGAG